MSDQIKLSSSQHQLLKILSESNGYVACDGDNRPVAHQLERMGLADWKGENWASSFWAITEEGRKHVR